MDDWRPTAPFIQISFHIINVTVTNVMFASQFFTHSGDRVNYVAVARLWQSFARFCLRLLMSDVILSSWVLIGRILRNMI